jgi:hypothetical protein
LLGDRRLGRKEPEKYPKVSGSAGAKRCWQQAEKVVVEIERKRWSGEK